MCKELKEIIEKIVNENPDVEQIATDWNNDQSYGLLWVKFPTSNSGKKIEFDSKYTDYVNDNYGDIDHLSLVCATDDELELQVYTLVYSSERGVIEDAI